MKRALELEDLYRIPQLSDPNISADGARVAFVVTTADRESDSYRSRIWVVPTDGGDPVEFTRAHADFAPRWSPDGRWLAFLSKRGEDDVAQLWVMPSGGGEARRLTRLAHGVADPVWSPDGASLAFVSRRAPAERLQKDGSDHEPVVITSLDYQSDGVGLIGDLRPHLFVVALDGGEPLQFTGGDFSVEGPAWSPDGTRLAFTSALHAGRDLEPGSSVFVVDARGGELHPLTDHEWSASAPVWRPDGRAIVFVASKRSCVGHNRLLEVPTAGGTPRVVAPSFDRNVMVGAPAYPGAPPRITSDGQTIVFCARDHGCTHVFTVPLAGGHPVKVVGEEDRAIGGMTLAPDVGTIAYVAASPTFHSEVFVAGLHGDNEKQLTDLFASALPDVSLSVAERRSFTSTDGRDLEGWVIRGGSDSGPLLLDIHGGPHNAWSPVFDGVHLYHQTLAAQGWTILFVNSRGSDGYGEDWYSAVVGGWGTSDFDDFMGAVDAVVDEGIVDPDRMSVTGYSYGGFMTNWITTHTRRFASAVTGGCISNLTSSFGSCDKGWPFAVLEMGATPMSDADQFTRLSPITRVDGVETPTLILHGQRDDRCPVGQAQEWFSALRLREKPVELVLYPGASHLFLFQGRPSHRIDYARRLSEWVRRHTPS